MPHALPGGKLLLYLRRRDQRAQAVLAHHPGAAALRAAGTADPCRLYVRGLCAVPPDARGGRGVFFIDIVFYRYGLLSCIDFATQKVTRISFEELQVNDKVIVRIRSSEMESFRSGGGENTIKVEQLQLYTQRAAG